MIPHVSTLPELAAQVVRCTMRPADTYLVRNHCGIPCGLHVAGPVDLVLPAEAGTIVADVAGLAPGWDAGAVVEVTQHVRGALRTERWVVVADTSTVRAWGGAAHQAGWLVGGPL